MGISKSVLMRNGVTATYWKIVDIHVDIQGLRSTIVLSPYLDQTSADNRLKPIGPPKVYVFTVIENNLFSRTLVDIYNAVLMKAASSVPNLTDSGTHIYDPDLVGGTLV